MSEVSCEYYECWDVQGKKCNGCRAFLQDITDGPVVLKDLTEPEKIAVLYFVKCTFVSFPQNIQSTLTGLRTLDIFDSTLESIGREHIGQMANLEILNIVRCGLKSLKGDTFRGLSKLQEISLNGNKLTEIDPLAFDGLESLRCVDLRNNTNINVVYKNKNKSFFALEQLKEELERRCKVRPAETASEMTSAEVEELKKKLKDANDQIVDLKDVIKAHSEEIDVLKQAKRELGEKLVQTKTFSSEFNRLLAEPAFKDLKIHAGEGVFKVNKILFAAKSPTLAEMLRKNPSENELTLPDISEATFGALHDFVYTNQLPEDKDFSLMELYAAASLLKIEDLRKIVANTLLASIDETNSFEVLVLVSKFDDEQLRAKAFENIKKDVFSDRQLDEELAKQPEKLKRLIVAKRLLEREYENL